MRNFRISLSDPMPCVTLECAKRNMSMAVFSSTKKLFELDYNCSFQILTIVSSNIWKIEKRDKNAIEKRYPRNFNGTDRVQVWEERRNSMRIPFTVLLGRREMQWRLTRQLTRTKNYPLSFAAPVLLVRSFVFVRRGKRRGKIFLCVLISRKTRSRRLSLRLCSEGKCVNSTQIPST